METDTSASSLSAERPSTSQDGRFVVYEKSVPNGGQTSQQIFLIDMQAPEAAPRLISKNYNDTTGLIPGNQGSFRPQISLDGSTVVFHSRASDLVPGDTNGKEDIFLYRVATNTLLRAVNDLDQQFNGRSLYPAVNGDGSKVVLNPTPRMQMLVSRLVGTRSFFGRSTRQAEGRFVLSQMAMAIPSTHRLMI